MPDYSLYEQVTAPFAERSYFRMVEKVSDYAIFLLDRDGVIQTWNPAAQVMKGYLKDEAIGREFSMFYTDEDQRRHRPAHNLAYAAEHATFQETAWRKRKDGSLFWALVEIIAIRNDANELESFCKVTRDLTNLKQLQGNLEAEKARSELMLDTIADGVIAVDNAGLVEYVNYQAQRLVGWSQEGAKGLPIEQVFDVVELDDYRAEEARLAQGECSSTSPRTTQILRASDGVRHMIETCQSEIPGWGATERHCHSVS